MRVPSPARPFLGALLDIAWPSDCFVCARALPLAQSLGACVGCWTRLTPLLASCSRCGEPTGASDLLGPAGLPCASCLLSRGRTATFQKVCPAVVYDGVARRFLLRAKLHGCPEILPALGAQLAAVVEAARAAEGCGAVVAVPSHPIVRLRRGFDPAWEIARPVAAALGLPLRRALRRRMRRGTAAKSLSAAARARVLDGAFAALRPRALPRAVLLVDDVLTTGATAAACAEALRSMGVEEVRLAVWARTPRRPPI